MIKTVYRLFVASILLMLFNTTTMAQPPEPYNATYDARFQGFRAKAEMSLSELANSNYQLHSRIRVKLLGKTLSTINENSLFSWQNEQLTPLQYSFVQSGIGKQSRSIEYDWHQNLATALVDDISIELELQQQTLDELSMYTEIKAQIAGGASDIYLDIIDENIIKQYHYRVLGEEQLTTPLGLFNTIKIERIRNPESKRITQLWLASDWNYLLLKLYQVNSKGKESYLNINQANVDNVEITALTQ